MALTENPKLPEDHPWGLVQRDNFDAYSEDCVVIQRDYLQWLASVLNETCNCGPHLDHADCLAEVQGFINYFEGDKDYACIGTKKA